MLWAFAANAFAFLHAQAPPTAAPVRLEAFQCVSVHPGQSVSLEWNPGFEHPGAVRRVGAGEMRLSRTDELARGYSRSATELGGRTGPAKVTDLGNGFYRLEVVLPRRLPAGSYRVTGASLRAVPVEGQDPAAVSATHSPVDQQYCINVSAPKATPTGS